MYARENFVSHRRSRREICGLGTNVSAEKIEVFRTSPMECNKNLPRGQRKSAISVQSTGDAPDLSLRGALSTFAQGGKSKAEQMP